MTVSFDAKSKRILWYNPMESREEALSRLNETTIWLDTSMPKAESKDGYYPVYYLNDDMQSIRVEYEQIPEPQPTQLDRIETQLNKSLDEIRAEGAAVASVNLMAVGAEMTKALAAAKMDVPATAGTFAEEWDEWTPDEKTATAKSLWQYKGVGYQARTDIQKIEVYAPDVATNNYAVRPIPDVNGISPGVLNMDVSIGMKVRDWEDGKVYICYANPITSLQWAPHNVPASFELYEG